MVCYTSKLLILCLCIVTIFNAFASLERSRQTFVSCSWDKITISSFVDRELPYKVDDDDDDDDGNNDVDDVDVNVGDDDDDDGGGNDDGDDNDNDNDTDNDVDVDVVLMLMLINRNNHQQETCLFTKFCSCKVYMK